VFDFLVPSDISDRVNQSVGS